MQATINGFRMNFAVEGPEAAPAVVLHHPLATDLSIWDELTAALVPRYRVVRFDARGHGASEATPAPYDLATLTADTIALMDHLGLARAHFLGLSMGGMVGQHLGLAHPQRFASLILCSTTSRMPPTRRARCGRSASRSRARRAWARRWSWRCRAGWRRATMQGKPAAGGAHASLYRGDAGRGLRRLVPAPSAISTSPTASRPSGCPRSSSSAPRT